MEQISLFLEKFKKLFAGNQLKKKVISETIFELIKVKINPDQISIAGKNISLKCSPIEKTEILVNKEVIIKKINFKSGEEIVGNIY
jgi:hypothetical protein